SSTGRGRAASCSRWPVRSTRARTRSSATSWPSVCSACRGGERMRFALTADQIALREAVRDLLAAECPPATVRAAWPPRRPELARALWGRLAEMGVAGVAVPEAAGGLGLGACEL